MACLCGERTDGFQAGVWQKRSGSFRLSKGVSGPWFMLAKPT